MPPWLLSNTKRASRERKEVKPCTLHLWDRNNKTDKFVGIEVGYSSVYENILGYAGISFS